MPNLPQDYFLKRKPEVNPEPAAVPWIFTGASGPDAGQFPYPHDYDRESFRFTRWGNNGNSVLLTMRIRTKYLHDALPRILGYVTTATIPSNQPLSRVLPIRFPADITNTSGKYWGLLASNILAVRLFGSSGKSASTASPGSYVQTVTNYDNATFFKASHRKALDDGGVGALVDVDAQDDPLSRFTWAEIDIEFSHLNYFTMTDANVAADVDLLGERNRFTRFNMTQAIEYYTVPPGYLIWDATTGPVGRRGQPATDLGGIVTSSATITVTWLNVPYEVLPTLFPVWDVQMGSCNGSVFSLKQFDQIYKYAEETLLFMSPTFTDPRPQANGKLVTDITYTYLWRPFGWNKFLYTDANYYKVTLKDGSPIYEFHDFTTHWLQ